MPALSIIIRTDSSLQIGSGHVMRCLTLADELRLRGAEVSFICRENLGNLIGLIEGKGYQIMRLPQPNTEYVIEFEDVAHAAWLGVPWKQDAAEVIALLGNTEPDWLIIDHYAIDHRWEEKLRPHVGKIMVIDDLADRPHVCDLLLDQNLNQGMETRYDNLVPGSSQKLLGPKYALLRPEFANARKNLRQRDGQVRRVMVFFGGVDPTNESEKTLRALASIKDRQFEIDVVVGGGNLHREQIRNLCQAHEGFHYHCQVDNMAELMVRADLAIGSGGATTWERCFLGLPSIVLILADNQKQTVKNLDRLGIIISLGDAQDITSNDICIAINKLIMSHDLINLSQKASALFNDKCDFYSLLLKGDIYA